MEKDTVAGKLEHWLSVQNLGRKNRTQEFNAEIVETVKKHWLNVTQPAASVTGQDVLNFAKKIEHYCPSRWNAIISALRAVTHQGNLLRRRKPRFREFVPPNQMEFSALLQELDKLPRSYAGLSVRFLSLTGLRICEAQQMRKELVGNSRTFVPAGIAKNGKARCIPFLPGMAETVEKLRTAAPDSELILPRPSFRRGLEKACLRAGLEPLSYHCFRHLFATNCIQSGVDLPTVARWLGHSDGGALLARMYFHLLDSHSREMADLVKML